MRCLKMELWGDLRERYFSAYITGLVRVHITCLVDGEDDHY